MRPTQALGQLAWRCTARARRRQRRAAGRGRVGRSARRSLACSAGGMPGPVSATVKRTVARHLVDAHDDGPGRSTSAHCRRDCERIWRSDAASPRIVGVPASPPQRGRAAPPEAPRRPRRPLRLRPTPRCCSSTLDRRPRLLVSRIRSTIPASAVRPARRSARAAGGASRRRGRRSGRAASGPRRRRR